VQGHVVTACTHQRSPVNGNGPPARPDGQNPSNGIVAGSDVPLPRRLVQRFDTAFRALQDAKIPPGKDIPHVTSPMITKHITDLQLLGLL
jgi:hypothetical protein